MSEVQKGENPGWWSLLSTWVQISLLEKCCKASIGSSHWLVGQLWWGRTLFPPAHVCSEEGGEALCQLPSCTKKAVKSMHSVPMTFVSDESATSVEKKKKNLCYNISNRFYYQLQNYGYCYKWFTLEIIRKVSPNWVCLVIGKLYHFKPPGVHAISLGSLVLGISPAI